MRLEKKPELVDKNMGREIERFLEFTGRDLWEDQIDKFRQQLSSKRFHFYKVWLQKRNPLLDPLQEYFQLVREGKSIWKNASPRLKYFSKHACILNIIINRLNEIGKNKILGDLHDPSRVKSFLFELQVATHFLVRGFDVYFLDLESSSEQVSFDFLAKTQNTEIEIECKRKSYEKKLGSGLGYCDLVSSIKKLAPASIGDFRCGIYVRRLVCSPDGVSLI